METESSLRLKTLEILSEIAAWKFEYELKQLEESLERCVKAGFDPSQPRVSAGNSDGGQWTDRGGSNSFSNYLRGRNDTSLIPSELNLHQRRPFDSRYIEGEGPINDGLPVESVVAGAAALAARRIPGGALAATAIRNIFNSGDKIIPAEDVNRTARALRDSQEWKLGGHKSPTKWSNRITSREWTNEEITETIKTGKQFEAPNKVNPTNTATRYQDPNTGKFVVIDDKTKEILQISKDNYKTELPPKINSKKNKIYG